VNACPVKPPAEQQLGESGKNIEGKKMKLQLPMFLPSIFLPPIPAQ
jgi:hypothetical protein